VKPQVLKKEDLKVVVDTTVQEKAAAYPTDARLYQTGRQGLVRLAKRHGLTLRQSKEAAANSLRKPYFHKDQPSGAQQEHKFEVMQPERRKRRK